MNIDMYHFIATHLSDWGGGGEGVDCEICEK